MIEFDVDMRYLLEADELDCVILNDESGECEPMKFTPELGNGTLTAEQVREAIERNFGKVAVLDDGEPVEWRDDWVCKVGINYKAIADELNARAERTCEPKWTLQGETQTQEFWRCECGNCGESFGVEDRSTFPFKMTIDEVEVPNFCPNCGARVKAAKQ